MRFCDMRSRFAALWTALGARVPREGDDALDRLRDLYDEPHRAYHSASHVLACLRLLDDPEVKALAASLPEVLAAIWFHDAVYDPRARDNEEASARLASEVLGRAGVAPEAIARIAAHVRATKDHVATSPDAQLVIDVDLSILGESPEVYARFEDAIRREYAWVPPADYAAGRAAVLGQFLARAAVYGTPLFRARYEARARENVAAAIAKLRP
jgi:predicted metal-dependent HD superfamily phosphohydrolase